MSYQEDIKKGLKCIGFFHQIALVVMFVIVGFGIRKKRSEGLFAVCACVCHCKSDDDMGESERQQASNLTVVG